MSFSLKEQLEQLESARKDAIVLLDETKDEFFKNCYRRQLEEINKEILRIKPAAILEGFKAGQTPDENGMIHITPSYMHGRKKE